ncbi:MAG TPA: M23 family metallopeptidase [Candidatus Atribacteria bacterium]|nr:M23 family metallopeptidase [Candidatus Atribacteria bacterium]HPT78371.1 M23 family metallopeptidase [Candidatus Atribacteria bacterium]
MGKMTFRERMKNTFSKKRFAAFLDRYGFYIVLMLCVCIVGITALLTANGHGNDKKDNLAEAADPTPTIAENEGDLKGDDKTDETGGSEETGDEDGENAGTGNEDDDSLPASGNKKDLKLMILPVNGEIINGFTEDGHLVYSKTLKQWCGHTGIDIKGMPGGEVKAAMDGVVESISEDPLRGIEIVLKHEHEKDLRTVYTGVSTGDMVKVGQQVVQGQTISGLGQTAAFEILDPAHLHFEVILDGECQDPLLFIKDN